MNRLIIIGNGVDLAHGLPTSYQHYINNFWETLHKNYKNELVQKMVHVDDSYDGFLTFEGIAVKTYKDLVKNIVGYAKEYGMKFEPTQNVLYGPTSRKNKIFEFKNKFFKTITIESIDNWVDIENIYYEILIGMVNPEKKKHNYVGNIQSLNSEFDDIKESLELYLEGKILKKFDFNRYSDSEESLLKYFTNEYKDLLNSPYSMIKTSKSLINF